MLLLMSVVAAAQDPAEEAIELARAEAMRALGITEADIRMAQAQAAEWSDSSLGCPEKGMQYMPVITSGHVVMLLTATETYTVHVAGDRAVICDVPPGAVRQPLSVRNEQVLNLVAMAREDLMTRVDDPSNPIKLSGLTPVQWPDASLGCARPGEAYAQVVTDGFVIELEHDENQYAYHAGNGRVVLCDSPR